MMTQKSTYEPYPFFFTLGWLFGIVGVIFWPLLIYGAISFYPKEMHADLMTSAFLLFYSAGFLMTAIPQFTGTYGLTQGECLGVSMATLLTLGTGFLQNRLFFHMTLTFNLLLLFLFCARRLKGMTVTPPPPFVFALTGLLVAILSGVGMSLHEATGSFVLWNLMGKNFIYNGFQLMLILGVGLFLIPNLLGHPTCVPGINLKPLYSQNMMTAFIKKIPTPLWILMGLFLFSCFLETDETLPWTKPVGRSLQVLIFTFVSFKSWQIYLLPKHRSTLTIGLWVSCWLLLIGLILPILFPHLEIHLKHLTYIGGYGLMTLMISTRVMLAHGGQDMSLEKRSRWLIAALGFILLAATTRTIARLMPEAIYLHHLNYAACSWIIGLICWAMIFRKKAN